MASNYHTHYIQHHGEPIPLKWGSWRVNTLELKRDGWEILAEERPDELSDSYYLRIGATCPEKKVLMQGCVLFPRSYFYAHSAYESCNIFDRIDAVPVQMITIRDHILQMPIYEIQALHKFKAVDHFPGMRLPEQVSYSLRDFSFFQYQKNNEIYIPPESVDDCLNKILKLQYPDQQAIKKKLIGAEAKPLITANILTLA